jgi:hypothetical protein
MLLGDLFLDYRLILLLQNGVYAVRRDVICFHSIWLSLLTDTWPYWLSLPTDPVYIIIFEFGYRYCISTSSRLYVTDYWLFVFSIHYHNGDNDIYPQDVNKWMPTRCGWTDEDVTKMFLMANQRCNEYVSLTFAVFLEILKYESCAARSGSDLISDHLIWFWSDYNIMLTIVCWFWSSDLIWFWSDYNIMLTIFCWFWSSDLIWSDLIITLCWRSFVDSDHLIWSDLI